MTPPKLTRRAFTQTLAGTALAAGLPSLTLAGELATLSVGDAPVSMLSDGFFQLPAALFQGVGAEALAGLTEPVEVGATVWLIRAGARRILVDTGSGQALAGMFPTVGKLDALFAAEGIAKEDITDIITNHMHADHIGGLMGPEAGGFKTATVHVAEAEWTFWTNPALREAAPDADKPMIELLQTIAAPLADRGQTYAGEADLGDGLTLMPLPGHTPGHSGVRLAADSGETFLIVGDAIISEALQFADPAITYALDADPQQAAATRAALLSMLADSGTLFSATHLTYPGTGRVRRDGSGFAFEPLS